MKEKFDELLQIKDITGVILFSDQGKVLFEAFNGKKPEESVAYSALYDLSMTCRQSHEMDVVYEDFRIYIRRAEIGYLMVLMNPDAPIAMVRLTSDMLIPDLKPGKQTKGLGRFFKRKS